MKSWPLTLLAAVLLPFAAAAQPAPQSTAAPCVPLAQVTPAMDPVYLTSAITACVRAGQLDAAVDLYNVAGVFARYDTLRIKDPLAHASFPALVLVLGQSLTPPQQREFFPHLERRSKLPGYQDALCEFTAKVGPPTYRPSYMARPGLDSFMDRQLGSPDFQPKAAWSRVRGEYLGCQSQVKSKATDR